MAEAKYRSITILGEEYRVAGETHGTSLSDLAAYVDGKMAELRRVSGAPDPTRIAVMTSLNIADELFRERAQGAEIAAEMEARVARIDSAVERILGEASQGRVKA
ncbi:MAG: cell division protein ZapA [Candidatus Eisenbacteria sp.]|nr:cell division protein ZapA [Candidatus Eisenbacteria bacterium]